MNNVGVYVHIPFCRSKCAYCAFTSMKCNERTIDNYLESLHREISLTLNKSHIVDTVYIGGGTPSILRYEDIERIIDDIKQNTAYQPIEVTIECNPESLTEEKILKYKSIGINRISMGVQSLNDDVLKIIGRVHSSREAIAKAQLVKKYDMNLSVDMILGLPKSTNNDIKNFIDTFSSIGVNHISAYSLSVEPNTRLRHMVDSGEVILPTEDETIDQYDLAYNLLKRRGYNRYEVSNFARAGYESRHNNRYWLMQEYIGIGLASHSYIDGKRYYNTSNLDEYIDKLSKGILPNTIDEELTLRDRVEETVMLGLRLEKGVEISKLNEIIGKSFLYVNKKNIDSVKEYITIDNGYLAIKPEYMNVMNTIIVDLLS